MAGSRKLGARRRVTNPPPAPAERELERVNCAGLAAVLWSTASMSESMSDELPPEFTGLKLDSDFCGRLLDTTHAVVVFIDCEGRVILCNQAMCELCDYELGELQGRDWFDTCIPEGAREHQRGLHAAALSASETQPRSHRGPLLTRSKELRQIEWRSDLVHDGEGEVIGLLSIGQDIGEQLELRARLAERERLASVGMMASIFAHEVGNPLNALFLQAQLLRRQIDRPGRGALAPRVDALLAELSRLNGLLADFRSFQSPTQLELELVELHALLLGISELLAPKAAAAGVELVCDVDDALPAITGSVERLRQVFLNLCKNAIEAMPEGGELELRARFDDARVLVTVRDCGVGIPAGVDVFAPFATTKPSGMGLGLALVREIIEAHAGTITCTSEPGVGTTFSVELPRHPSQR